MQSFLHLVAVPGDNDDNTVVASASMTTSSGRTVAAASVDNDDNTMVALASMTTSSGGTVAAASVAAFVDVAWYCQVIGSIGCCLHPLGRAR